MSKPVITVINLSKKYQLGPNQNRKSLKFAAESFVRNSFKLMRPRFAIDKFDDVEFWALKNVSFKVLKGETVGIMGPNGSGKSTLLKILSSISPPTQGKIILDGNVTSLLELGTSFHSDLTGRENIFLNGAIMGMTQRIIKKKFSDIVDFAEIKKFIDVPVKWYSSGMYLRLAFSVAVHLIETEILIIDEVLSVGDMSFQKKCLDKIRELTQKNDITVLIVSHNTQIIKSLCQKVIYFSNGTIKFFGLTDEGINLYLNQDKESKFNQIKLTNFKRPKIIKLPKLLLITKVILDNLTSRAVFQTDQPLAMKIEFKTFRSVTDLIFGIAIHSGDIRLFECLSSDKYGLIKEIAPGKYSIKFILTHNPLVPGIYSLHIGAKCAKQTLDWLPDVIFFRVIQSKEIQPDWVQRNNGLVTIQSNWTKPTLSH